MYFRTGGGIRIDWGAPLLEEVMQYKLQDTIMDLTKFGFTTSGKKKKKDEEEYKERKKEYELKRQRTY